MLVERLCVTSCPYPPLSGCASLPLIVFSFCSLALFCCCNDPISSAQSIKFHLSYGSMKRSQWRTPVHWQTSVISAQSLQAGRTDETLCCPRRLHQGREDLLFCPFRRLVQQPLWTWADATDAASNPGHFWFIQLFSHSYGTSLYRQCLKVNLATMTWPRGGVMVLGRTPPPSWRWWPFCCSNIALLPDHMLNDLTSLNRDWEHQQLHTPQPVSMVANTCQHAC